MILNKRGGGRSIVSDGRREKQVMAVGLYLPKRRARRDQSILKLSHANQCALYAYISYHKKISRHLGAKVNALQLN